jgi:hypothetical protein
MKKLLCSILLIASVALIVTHLFLCVENAQLYHAGMAATHAALTVLWVIAASDAVGGLSPSFKAWRHARWSAFVTRLCDYRVCREISYAIAFLIPLIALPVIALSIVLFELFRPIRAAYRFVRESWGDTCAARRDIERAYQRESLRKAASSA